MTWIGPGEHEGWVVPLFADGAQGAGSTGSQGILVERRPGDGPLDGDRVRLSYPDSSTVEGLWQDDTLLADDGRVLAHTRGQVQREILGKAEQWRPDAAVVGWAAACECGWRGKPWTRVHSATAAGSTTPTPSATTSAIAPDDSPVVDHRNRLIFQPGPYAYLGGQAEDTVGDEWRAHIAPLTVLEDLAEAAAAHAGTARALDAAVRAARATGASWTDIGRAVGMTKQSAHTRWRDLDPSTTPVPAPSAAGEHPAWTGGTWWDVEVRWDGESHTAERPFGLFSEARAWCAATVTDLFRDADPGELAAAAALIERIGDLTGESRGYQLIDDTLACEVYLSASGDPAGLGPVQGTWA